MYKKLNIRQAQDKPPQRKEDFQIPSSTLINNRPDFITQTNRQNIANNSPKTTQLKAFQNMANNSQAVQQKTNNTGLPYQLKSGIENLSSIAMDDVKVHYNSSKPAQLQAHAYAQGTDIHLAPGQEKHLPHEAWHVVQQKQGRVQPTTQLKGKVNINDDAGLEQEADVMGVRALQMNSKLSDEPILRKTKNNFTRPPIQRIVINNTNFDWLGNTVLDTSDFSAFKRIVLNHYNITGSRIHLQELERFIGKNVSVADQECYHFLNRFMQTKLDIQSTDSARPATEEIKKKFTHAVINVREILIPEAITKLNPWAALSPHDRHVIEYCFGTEGVQYDAQRKLIIKTLQLTQKGLEGAYPISDVSDQVRKENPDASGYVNPVIDKLNLWVQFTGGRRIHIRFDNSLAETTFILIHEATHLHAGTIDGINKEGKEAAYIRSGYSHYMDWDTTIGRGLNPAGSELRNVGGKFSMVAKDPNDPQVKKSFRGPQSKGMVSNPHANADSFALLVYGLNGINPP